MAENHREGIAEPDISTKSVGFVPIYKDLKLELGFGCVVGFVSSADQMHFSNDEHGSECGYDTERPKIVVHHIVRAPKSNESAEDIIVTL